MTSTSLPFPLSQARKRTKAEKANQTTWLRTIAIVCAALLILFAWLHLILALDIASTGRQIQLKIAELDELQRGNDMLRWQTARALASEEMAKRAAELGYKPQAPVYLPLTQPAPQD